eukprot:UN06668
MFTEHFHLSYNVLLFKHFLLGYVRLFLTSHIHKITNGRTLYNGERTRMTIRARISIMTENLWIPLHVFLCLLVGAGKSGKLNGNCVLP